MSHPHPTEPFPRPVRPSPLLLLLAAVLVALGAAALASRAPAAEVPEAPRTGARAMAPETQDENAPDSGEAGDMRETDEVAPEPPPDPDAPTPVPERVAIAAAFPLAPLLPESEFVFGPTLYGFDVARVAAEQGGYLATYVEQVGDERLDGPAIVTRVAREHGLGPRMLLTLLELESSWVSEAPPPATTDPLGVDEPGLYSGLSRMAAFLNQAYYGRRAGASPEIVLADAKSVAVETGNPGSWAVLAWLSRTVPSAEWAGLEPASRFWTTWHQLYDADPLYFGNLPVRAAPTPPPLALPFAFGSRWYAIAGPTAPRGAGPPAEISFAPPPAEATGCFGSVEAVTAPITAIVRWSESYGALLDPNLDNDGWEGTGWSLVLRHLSPADRIPAGNLVRVGEPLGFPYCEEGGGQTRVSLALRYDGAWVAAVRPGASLNLSGWLVGDLGMGRPDLPARSFDPAKVDGLNDIAALLE